MRKFLIAVAFLSSSVLAAPPSGAPQSAHDRLFALFAASDEDDLKLTPVSALHRGDLRYADHIGDYFTDAHDAAEQAAGEADLAALHRIDRAALNATDQLAYDVFEWQTLIKLKAYRDPELRRAFAVQPINHFDGLQLGYPDIASG